MALATILAVVNRRLFVYEDPRIELVEGMLPHAIADLLGVEVGKHEKRVARLACAGGTHVARIQALYRGLKSCRAAAVVAGGQRGCVWGCLGFGDCAEVCDVEAITLDRFNLKNTLSSRVAIERCPTGAPASPERALEENGTEVWALMQDPNTHVYVAGLRKSFENLGKTMARIADTDKAWQRKKKELVFYEQWSELVYD